MEKKVKKLIESLLNESKRPSWRTARTSSNTNRQNTILAKKYVHKKLKLPGHTLSSPVLIYSFDGKNIKYRLKGDDKIKTMEYLHESILKEGRNSKSMKDKYIIQDDRESIPHVMIVKIPFKKGVSDAEKLVRNILKGENINAKTDGYVTREIRQNVFAVRWMPFEMKNTPRTEGRLIEIEITDPEIEKKIREYARLSDEMDRLKNELKQLENQYKPIDEELRLMLEEIDATRDRALQVKGLLVTVKRSGYEANSIGYKEAFTELYNKVNAAMKKQADEIIERNTKIKKVASSIGVQKTESKLQEGPFSGLISKLKSYLQKGLQFLKGNGQQIDNDIAKMTQLVNRK